MEMNELESNKKIVRVSSILIHGFFILMTLCFVFPVAMIVSVSVTKETSVFNFGYRLIPREFSVVSYQMILKNPETVLTGYRNSIIVTLVGTFLNIMISSMCAFAISRKDFKYRRAITFYLFFTILFSGGLVPYYILMTQFLKVGDTLIALILPLMVNVFYIFIMRSFFQGLPVSIIESSKIDGANEFRIYFQIILALSKPVLATIGLFVTLQYWNDWFQALLFINNEKLYPLQYLLQRLMNYIDQITRSMKDMTNLSVKISELPTESLRMAMVVVAAGPMLFIFPFFQKYFIKGLTIGSVKG